jgi:hypothetical protein
VTSRVLASPVDLDTTGHYLTWGFVQISVANLVIIIIIGAVFLAALFVPFPGSRRRGGGEDD